MAEIKAKKVIFKNRDGEYLLPYVGDTAIDNRITNCILEVPQRINLTLENNTLTLHAGSVAIIPYGREDKTDEFPIGSAFINDNMKVYDAQYANGKFFVWAETQLDVTYNPSNLSNRTNQLFLKNYGGNLSLAIGAPNSISSGDTFPDELGWHYHTADNIVYRDTKAENISLPLAIVTNVKDVGCTSIDKIFNGFGYIGNTAFSDKGIKCLISNGRNEDRTLRNIEYTTSTMGIVTSQVGNFNDNIWLRIHSNPITIGVIKPERYHDSDNNYYVMDGKKVQHCVVGKMVVDSTLGITEFNVKQPFRAVDYNDALVKTDKQEIMNWGLPDYSSGIKFNTTGSLTYTYTAPASGFIHASSIQLKGVRAVLVNGKPVGKYSTPADGYPSSLVFIVTKGDVITTESNLGIMGDCYFYPLKGAN